MGSRPPHLEAGQPEIADPCQKSSSLIDRATREGLSERELFQILDAILQLPAVVLDSSPLYNAAVDRMFAICHGAGWHSPSVKEQVIKFELRLLTRAAGCAKDRDAAGSLNKLFVNPPTPAVAVPSAGDGHPVDLQQGSEDFCPAVAAAASTEQEETNVPDQQHRDMQNVHDFNDEDKCAQHTGRFYRTFMQGTCLCQLMGHECQYSDCQKKHFCLDKHHSNYSNDSTEDACQTCHGQREGLPVAAVTCPFIVLDRSLYEVGKAHRDASHNDECPLGGHLRYRWRRRKYTAHKYTCDSLPLFLQE